MIIRPILFLLGVLVALSLAESAAKTNPSVVGQRESKEYKPGESQDEWLRRVGLEPQIGEDQGDWLRRVNRLPRIGESIEEFVTRRRIKAPKGQKFVVDGLNFKLEPE